MPDCETNLNASTVQVEHQGQPVLQYANLTLWMHSLAVLRQPTLILAKRIGYRAEHSEGYVQVLGFEMKARQRLIWLAAL